MDDTVFLHQLTEEFIMQVSSSPQVSQMAKRKRPQMTAEQREKIQELKQKMSKSKSEAPQKSPAAKAQSSAAKLGLSGQDALALRKQAAS